MHSKYGCWWYSITASIVPVGCWHSKRLANSGFGHSGVVTVVSNISQCQITRICAIARAHSRMSRKSRTASYLAVTYLAWHRYSLPFPLSFPPLVLSSLPFPGGPHPINQLWGLEECWKPPSRVRGKAPADERFGAYLSQKEQLWCHEF